MKLIRNSALAATQRASFGGLHASRAMCVSTLLLLSLRSLATSLSG
jgi:hypothetical protein